MCSFTLPARAACCWNWCRKRPQACKNIAKIAKTAKIAGIDFQVLAILALLAILAIRRMLILGIDTSGKSGGVSLAEASEHSFRVLGSAPIAGGTFSAQLVPTLASLLQEHGAGVRDLGGFAVASGPGSFTGLRVGLSAIKALAEVLHKPIATVSLLEALASMSPAEGRVLAALDAGRSEVFLGLYEVEGGTATRVTEQLVSATEFVEQARSSEIAMVVTSDESIGRLVSATAANWQLLERPGSSLIARIGARKLRQGESVSVEALDANYLRRSDAEIFFKGTRG
jgi:tRNA threonylcarbamoyladenosine biosynthesis protein TsaB